MTTALAFHLRAPIKGRGLTQREGLPSMRVLLQTAAAAAFVVPFLAGQAAMAAPLYGKVSVGQSEAEVSGINLDEGLSYGAAVGTAVGPFRVEAGVDRLSGSLDFFGPSINADATDFRASAFLDLPVGDRASVFAGAGVDYIDAEASAFGTEIGAEGAGWHWAVGGAYRLSENIIGEVQYRQLSADLDADFIGDVDLDATQVSAGLRFAF